MEYELAKAKGRVFYGKTQLETMETFMKWFRDRNEFRRGSTISLLCILVSPGSEGEEFVTAFYEELD